MTKLINLIYVASLCVLIANQACIAAPVYNTSAAGELIGSRTAVQLGFNGDWGSSGESVSWIITDNQNGTFDYEYTFTGFSSSNISHFTLDLSDNPESDASIVTDAELNGSAVTLEIKDGAIDNQFKSPGITGAVKFDDGAAGNPTYSFTSNRTPVYGDFFLKGGGGVVERRSGIQFGIWRPDQRE